MIPPSLLPLANHLWQSSWFAAGAGLLTLALRSIRAHLRYRIWLAASLKFLIPFSVLAALAGRVAQRSAPPIPPVEWPSAVSQAAVPFVVPVPASGAPPSHGVFPSVLLAVWFAGFAILLAVWCRRWCRVRAAVRSGSPMNLPSGARTVSSPAIFEPGVFGIWRPVLVLPEGIAGRLPPPQLEAILAHELCHVRRRDNLASALHMGVQAVFWFHPLVWWLGARLLEERERACDEEVLRAGIEPRTYAEGILQVCDLYLESPLACVSGVTGTNLKSRIERIMTPRIDRRLSSARKFLLAGAALLAVIAPLLTGVLSGPLLHAQSQAATFGKPSGPKFEVASVKPAPDRQTAMSAGLAPHEGIRLDAARVDIGDWSITQLILRAYGLQPCQLSGPQWMNSLRFDIAARFPQGAAGDQLPEMLQWLLAERFDLAAHGETRDLPVFALVVGKGGPKMKPAPPDPDAPADPPSKDAVGPNHSAKLGRTLDSLWGDGKSFGLTAMDRAGGNLHFEFSKLPMDALAQILASYMREPVIDMTGLAGRYRVTLDFSPGYMLSAAGNTPGSDPSAVATEPTGPSVFSAVQRLGLRLERRKAPIALLVVDRLDSIPKEN
jgi:uncharacterized protein (TIGR03435 family)